MQRMRAVIDKNFFTYNDGTYFDAALIIVILQYLDLTSLGRMERVNQFFKKNIDKTENHLWYDLLIRYFPEQIHFNSDNIIKESKNKLNELEPKDSIFYESRYITLARLVRGGDFSKELLMSKGYPSLESFFEAINQSFNRKKWSDYLIHDAVYRCKNQMLLDYIFEVQLKKFISIDGEIDVKKLVSDRTVLHYACICNQPINLIKDLIEKGADYNEYVYGSDYNPLRLAAIGGRSEIVKLLLTYEKISIYGLNHSVQSQTPLYLATQYAELETIKLLLADTRNQTDEALELPFRLAVEKGFDTIVNIFIKTSSSLVNLVNNCWAGTPLCVAVASDQLHIFDLLIKNGAKVNCQGDNGAAPIQVAVGQDMFKYISLLVSHGADINLPGKNDALPLVHAIKKNRIEYVHELLFHGADIEKVQIDYNQISKPILSLIKTFTNAKKTYINTQSLLTTARNLLNDYLSPKSFFGELFELTGTSARFFAGKHRHYSDKAERLFENIKYLDDSDIAIRLVKEIFADTLSEIDKTSTDKFYSIIAAIHILSNDVCMQTNLEKKKSGKLRSIM